MWDGAPRRRLEEGVVVEVPAFAGGLRIGKHTHTHTHTRTVLIKVLNFYMKYFQYEVYCLFTKYN
jgi:hypothetical protein